MHLHNRKNLLYLQYGEKYFTIPSGKYSLQFILYSIGSVGKYIYMYTCSKIHLHYKKHLLGTCVVTFSSRNIHSEGEYIYKAPDSSCALAYSYAH